MGEQTLYAALHSLLKGVNYLICHYLLGLISAVDLTWNDEKIIIIMSNAKN